MHIRDVLRTVLWVTPITLQSLIAVIMVRRRLVRIFPCFFVYSVYVLARDVVLWVVRRHPDLYAAYFWIYWCGEPISILLQLGVIYEVLYYLTGPYEFVRRLAGTIFKIVMSIAILVACFVFGWVAIAPGAPIFDVILLLERSARVAQVVVLITVIAFISRLGLTWHHYATGILLGSGLAGLQLVPAELRGNHLISNETFVWLKPAIYNVAVIGWAAYFFAARSRRIDLASLPETDLNRWELALKEYLRKR
jgi:hypothetical protein